VQCIFDFSGRTEKLKELLILDSVLVKKFLLK